MVGRAEVTQSLGSPGESLPVPAVFRSTELAFPLRALVTNSRNPFQSLPATLHFCHTWPLANCNSAKNILSRKEPDIVRLKTIYGGDTGLFAFVGPLELHSQLKWIVVLHSHVDRRILPGRPGEGGHHPGLHSDFTTLWLVHLSCYDPGSSGSPTWTSIPGTLPSKPVLPVLRSCLLQFLCLKIKEKFNKQ